MADETEKLDPFEEGRKAFREGARLGAGSPYDPLTEDYLFWRGGWLAEMRGVVPKRAKVTQIAATSYELYALKDDGTIWHHWHSPRDGKMVWVRVPGPGEETTDGR